jgi:membrane-associated protease RseP (regulator of RpoE activity)
MPNPPAVSAEEAAALAARVEELTDGWGRMQAELAELRQRVATVERQASATTGATAQDPRLSRPATPAQERDALLRAGVTPEVADDLVWRRSQLSLARLELRDEAARDGWLGTARYREELGRINEQQVSVEDEIGLDAYDRYLFETGQSNRVAVDSVLPGSAGEESGLQAGDVIERYGEARVLDFQDLRAATSAGERGELVPVAVRRNGQLLELWLPRGPIGIGLDAARLDPNG